MNEESTVYIVDADSSARRSMAEIARSKGLQVREFESAEQVLVELPLAEARACLIADATTIDTRQQLRDTKNPIPLVVVGPDDARTAVRAMQQGAVTYLPKSCETHEFLAAVDTALERAGHQQRAMRQTEELRQRFEQLSASEREVLARVMEGQPNRQIANEMDIGLRTVELRRSNIMRKTGANNLLELTRLTIEVDFPQGLSSEASANQDDQQSVA
jgi:FixJ family two-component response regulator